MVAKVQVTVLDQGQVLEKGAAQHRDGNWWEFATNSDGTKVLAKAWDLPGNIAQFSISQKFSTDKVAPELKYD
jgi:hypothetical protein